MNSFTSRKLQSNADVAQIRNFLQQIPGGPVVSDFEETIQTSSVRETTRLWYQANDLKAFAYVDDYNNLNFEILPDSATVELESEIVDWGMKCMRLRNQKSGESCTLDSVCERSNQERVNLLLRSGFSQDQITSLLLERDITNPFPQVTLPSGYIIRPVHGESEVEDLVALHRAAFETDHMTVEYRLAMMCTNEYDPNLDWVVQASDGKLAALCIGSVDETDPSIGYLDPVGTAAGYRGLGLAKGLMLHGMATLAARGVKNVRFGTSSENQAMLQLSSRLGFKVRSDSLWFSKKVD